MHDNSTPDNLESTSDILCRERKVRLDLAIDADRANLAARKPARWYTHTAIAVAATAGLDWATIAAHTVYRRHDGIDTLLGTHLAFFGVLNVCAIALIAVRAYWTDQCDRDTIRDRIADHRHELQMDEIRRIRLDALRRDQARRDEKWTQVGKDMERRFAELRAVGGGPPTAPDPAGGSSTVLRFPGPRTNN
ncbi:hypothetical protein AB0L22_09485 [Micromonospora haikouensis]|uniref:hypothetical protein n=1 Tax=Micromonospora haikouensis TaxID=686309 RepID=UPI003420186E